VALAPGTRLGAYEILTLIGEGGIGEVYRRRNDLEMRRDSQCHVVNIRIYPETSALSRRQTEA